MEPHHVGLPAGVRRRSPGLRREEVAALANVSPSWYTSLEQGRKIRPSVEVLDCLADALRLDRSERRYVHALGAAPADSVLPDPSAPPEAVRQIRRLIRINRDTPYPAYAADGAGGLLAWNTQMAQWYDDFSVREGRECNIVWWMFTAPLARTRFVDWAQEARELTARVRFSAGSQRVTDAMRGTLDDLRTASPEFAALWDEHDVLDHGVRRRTFRHPGGRQTLDVFVVRPNPSPTVSIVFHLPTTDDAPG